MASLTLPLLHAYHAALYTREAHSLNDPSRLGRCVIADFTWGKSAWQYVQFSCSPVGNSAERFLIKHCFHASSCSFASSHFRVASCTSLCILKTVRSEVIEMNEKSRSVRTFMSNTSSSFNSELLSSSLCTASPAPPRTNDSGMPCESKKLMRDNSSAADCLV